MRRVLAIAGLLALLGACALLPTKIGTILQNPDRYENHVVTVRGKVTGVTKMPFMADGMYHVDDGTGSLMVVTRKALPQEGTTVMVRGKVRSSLQIGGKSFGLALHEE